MNRDPRSAKQLHLQENDLFRDLKPAEIDALGARTFMKRVPAGTVFHRPEQPVEVIFILKEGRVRLYRMAPDGRTLTIAVLEAGTVFGEMVLLGQKLHDSYAEAVDPCLLCLMSREDVRTLLLGDPRIALRIAELLGERLLESQQRLSDFAFKRVPERLAAVLTRQAVRRRSLLARDGPLVVRHTHEALANLTGTSRETVSRILGEWSAQGVVALGRGMVRLIRPDELERLAQAMD